MANTNRLGLPLLLPAQAQKHVTVNEALTRVDGLVQLTLVSGSLFTPPSAVADGEAYSVPTGGVNEWEGHDGEIAIRTNGGWDFVIPKRGWRAIVLDQGCTALFDGSAWRPGMVTLSPNNAGLAFRVAETDHMISPGSISTTPGLIPPNSVVVGVTARVTAAISGSLTS